MEPTADHDDNIAQSPSTRANAAADDGGPLHPWMPVTFASRSPGSRVFPSAVVHGDSLYIFGGHDGGVYRNDLLVFNLETRVWLLDLELTGGGPSPRDAHAAVVHDEWMYVFGGYDSKRYLNDFHRFHFDDLAWSSVPVGGGAPSPRGGHTAVVHAGEMLVFGGCDGWNYFNDLYARAAPPTQAARTAAVLFSPTLSHSLSQVQVQL